MNENRTSIARFGAELIIKVLNLQNLGVSSPPRLTGIGLDLQPSAHNSWLGEIEVTEWSHVTTRQTAAERLKTSQIIEGNDSRIFLLV